MRFCSVFWAENIGVGKAKLDHIKENQIKKLNISGHYARGEGKCKKNVNYRISREMVTALHILGSLLAGWCFTDGNHQFTALRGLQWTREKIPKSSHQKKESE